MLNRFEHRADARFGVLGMSPAIPHIRFITRQFSDL